MTPDNTNRVELGRRKFIGAAGAGLIGAGIGSAPAGAGSGRGDGGGGDGGGGGGGDTGESPDEVAVTLVTGETVYVSERGDRRVYEVDADEPRSFHLETTDDGTYVFPLGVDLDRFSPLLFNVDALIEQGLTDAETDGTPVIVRTSGTARGAGIEATGRFTPERTLESIGAVAGTVRKDRTGAETTGRDLLESDAVAHVALDARYEATLDAAAEAIEAPAAREAFDVDGDGVTIAVVDSGIDDEHPDLDGRVVERLDFTAEGTGDDRGHGTHVAGIAAGDGSASDGTYVGVAPGADLVSAKVLGADGTGTAADIVAAVEAVVEAGVDVINMSLGGPVQEDDPLVAAVNAAADEGVAVVVSSGNSYGHESLSSPGVAEGAITVGAADHEVNEIADFSSGGPTPTDFRLKPEVAAPGVDVASARAEGTGLGTPVDDDYTRASGTSMAAPMVAGLVALALEADADRAPDEVRATLVSTADPLSDVDPLLQGGGVVNAVDALDPDVRVHDPVIDFGVTGEPTTFAETIVLENVSDERVELEANAALWNVLHEERRDDSVELSDESVTIDPGEVETVDLAVDAADATGNNAGRVTFDDGTRTYVAAFAFTRAFEVSVQKIPEVDRDEIFGGWIFDNLRLFSHDGTVFEVNPFNVFDDDGHYTTTVPTDGTYTLTSYNAGAEELRIVVETVEVDGATDIVLDERETVPIEFDTSDLAHHEPLGISSVGIGIYRTYENGGTGTTQINLNGPSSARVWFSPLDQGRIFNLSTEYLLVPEASHEGEDFLSLDNPAVYHLFYPRTSVPEDGAVIEPLEEELIPEEITYRAETGTDLHVWPHVLPVPDIREDFPAVASSASTRRLGPDRRRQTWYRNEYAQYGETWRDGGLSDERWRAERLTDLVPDPGSAYRTHFNRAPLTPRLTDWSLEEELTFRFSWYVDQFDDSIVVNQRGGVRRNEYEIAVDGEVVAAGTHLNASREFPIPFAGDEPVEDLEPGTEIDVRLAGNALSETHRKTRTEAAYSVTYDPGTANVPPQIDRIDVAGLDRFNEAPAGALVVFAESSTPLEEFAALYAESGTVAATPFDDPDGWRHADVVRADGDRYALLLDTTGFDGIDLAFAGVDADGNAVETTTFDAVGVTGAADDTVALDVRPTALDVGSNRSVPAVVEATDDVDPHAIDVDTVRIGDPEAVAAGGGASPHGVQELGNGSLQVQFRASEAGYARDRSPAAVRIVGKLEDGTVVSGADVVDEVRGA